MKITVLLAGVSAAIIAATSVSAAEPLAPEVRALANQFFGKVKAGDSVGAFQAAFKESTSTPAATLQGVAGSTGAVLASFGGVIDWAPYAREVLTPTFIRETYYVRTREQAVFFTLNFYNPTGAWRITDIQFGTFYHMKDRGYLIDPD